MGKGIKPLPYFCMKVYTRYDNNKFFFSIITEERLHKMIKLLHLYCAFGLAEGKVLYDSNNLSFTIQEIFNFLESPKDAGEGDLEVLGRLEIKGFDIYAWIERLLESYFLTDFDEYSCKCICVVPKEVLEIIRPMYLELFTEEKWREVTE